MERIVEIAITNDHAQIRETCVDHRVVTDKLYESPIAIGCKGNTLPLLVRKILPEVRVISNGNVYKGKLKEKYKDRVTLETNSGLVTIMCPESIYYSSKAKQSELILPVCDNTPVTFCYKTKAISWKPEFSHIISNESIATILYGNIESESSRNFSGAILVASGNDGLTYKYRTCQTLYQGENIIPLSEILVTSVKTYYVIDLLPGHQYAMKEISFKTPLDFPAAHHTFINETGLSFCVHREGCNKGERITQAIKRTSEVTACVEVKTIANGKRVDFVLNASQNSNVVFRYPICAGLSLGCCDFNTYTRGGYFYIQGQVCKGERSFSLTFEKEPELVSSGEPSACVSNVPAMINSAPKQEIEETILVSN